MHAILASETGNVLGPVAGIIVYRPLPDGSLLASKSDKLLGE
jgi:hypothetical protein